MYFVAFQPRFQLPRNPSHATKYMSDIKCIASKVCTKRFNCPSAQLHHLESGVCVSGMTKNKLNAIMISKDTEWIITSSASQTENLGMEAPMARLEIASSPITEERDADSETESGVIFTPTSSDPVESNDFFASLRRPIISNFWCGRRVPKN